MQAVEQVYEWLSNIPAQPWSNRAAYLAAFQQQIEGLEQTGAIAAVGGFCADRLGYAFIAGYHAALRRLVGDASDGRVACLCVTEEKGAHPAAIETRLEAGDDGFTLDGAKRWSTMADRGDDMLVAASVGWADGRNRIRMVRVPTDRAGIELTQQPETPFTPEIPHFSVRFSAVQIAAAEVLPGDGYAKYIKPFRTIEDIHVFLAASAYALREVRRGPDNPDLEAQLVHLLIALQRLAGEEPTAPTTHIALHGLTTMAKPILTAINLEPLGDGTHERWVRDQMLLSVAQRARQRRIEVALAAVSSG